MWSLIVMVCVGLECSDIEIRGIYSTEAACVKAMELIEIESGAYGCIAHEPEDITT